MRKPIEKRAEYYYYQFLDFNLLPKKYRDINAIQMLKQQYTNIYKKAIADRFGLDSANALFDAILKGYELGGKSGRKKILLTKIRIFQIGIQI